MRPVGTHLMAAYRMQDLRSSTALCLPRSGRYLRVNFVQGLPKRGMAFDSHRGYLTREHSYKPGRLPAAFVKRNELLGSAGSAFRGRRVELDRVRHEFAFGEFFRVNDDAITHVQIR